MPEWFAIVYVPETVPEAVPEPEELAIEKLTFGLGPPLPNQTILFVMWLKAAFAQNWKNILMLYFSDIKFYHVT